MREELRQRWARPALVAVLVIVIDQLSKAWIWHDGGGYFGVPFSNFMGWFLCVYTIFQLLALYLMRTRAHGGTQTGDDRKHTWHQVTALYGATFVEFASMAPTPPSRAAAPRYPRT